MKKVSILVFSIAIVISFTHCTSPSAEKLCSDAETRGEILFELMNNNAYLSQVMDTLRTKHTDAILTTSSDMMKSDKAMGGKMMDNMMDMCMSDTGMCKRMMDKTMEMCDMDKSKCNMMLGSMQEHPKSMKSMKEMGMCDMKGMEKKMGK